jgi:hypothetical protein
MNEATARGPRPSTARPSHVLSAIRSLVTNESTAAYVSRWLHIEPPCNTTLFLTERKFRLRAKPTAVCLPCRKGEGAVDNKHNSRCVWRQINSAMNCAHD